MIAQEQIERSKARLQFDPGKVRTELGRNPPRDLSGPRRDNLVRAGVEPFDLAKERILGKNDLLNFNYFGLGAEAGRCVGRVQIRDGTGQLTGFGTGFLVGPRLMITNNHVLGSEVDAEKSLFEARYELGNDGRPVESVKFELRPEECFVTDKELDFTLVAVAEESRDGDKLSSYGWLQLVPTPGKAAEGESLSVIQHPSGDYKQVAIRENLLLKALDRFLWYQSDTAPGSSGSPVFNDQWQVVALHHSGVPATDEQGRTLTMDRQVWTPDMPDSRILWTANEGVRISTIVDALRNLSARPALLQDLLDRLGAPAPAREQQPAVATASDRAGFTAAEVGEDGSISLTIPLQLTVRMGDGAKPRPAARTTHTVQPIARPPVVPISTEAISIDPDYADREGYRVDFIGVAVPLPKLGNLVTSAAMNRRPGGGDAHVLPYHHFSVVLNAERQMCFYTAVNIDGTLKQTTPRDKDKWFYDPRVGRDEQTGPDLYAGNDLDLGHMVRRLDPAWGEDRQVARVANDDTFHLTNACPQHANLNRVTWASLEDYLLANAQQHGMKVSVFTGPIFSASDPPYRGRRIPQQFWKVAAIVKDDGNLSATGYMISQQDLLADLPEEAQFVYGAFKTYQVPVAKIEKLTGLDFGKLRNFDPKGRLEAAGPREITGPGSLLL